MSSFGKSPYDDAGAVCYHLVPDRGETWNLGSINKPFNNIYFSGSAIGPVFDLANNTYLQARNAADTGFVGLIKASATDNTVVNAITGKQIQFDINSVIKWHFDTAGSLVGDVAASKIIGGATSLLFRNAADLATNLSIADAGLVTVGVGNLRLTAGKLIFDAALSKIVPGASSLAFRDTADAANNILIADAGTVTFRGKLIPGGDNTLDIGDSAGNFWKNIYLKSTLAWGGTNADLINGTGSFRFRDHANAVNLLTIADAGDVNVRVGNLLVSAAGKTVTVQSGSNAKSGTVVVNGATGTTVTTTAITANSVVQYGLKTVGGTIAGKPYESAVTPGTSFVVKAGASDTSTYNYIIMDLV